MSAPDRPTREQVDAALARVDVVDSIMSGTSRAGILAAEVRALRAELDGLRIGLDVETRRADDWQRVADGLAEDAARAAGVAHTPQPAEPAQCSSCDGTEWACYACQAPHEGWLYEAPRVPLPAVPDGEDRPTDAEFDAFRASIASGRGPTPLDGGDVPARLDAAADALAAADLARGAAALRDAASVASIAGPDVRAAVAAALARPTGGQE